jgi:hypothetical protein
VKKVTIAKSADVAMQPFVLGDFVATKDTTAQSAKVSKKELKMLAKELNLDYNNGSITFAKKLLNEYIKKNV